ncbi:hypothetical protein O7606_22765 [Micromonospora sp. WMMD882]|uniref:hypothetical protein n=1 Tax=Micromonospora sp. WMMD882 TaxID=3015151 RepID=UPI00248BD4CA|nr:hypothetical protein [Micromonospora sp. WMMD882]WBB78984.1 hypothetical protein O7606_22765 [Micromonospora sp. WMMD882]
MFASASSPAAPDPWSDEVEPAGFPPPRTGPGVDGPAGPRKPRRFRPGGGGPSVYNPDEEFDDGPEEDEEEIEPVEINKRLALTIAGFALLLGVGLVLGAQTSGPGHRLPFSLVVFGVQLLFVLAWTMATRPPALLAVAGAATLTAVAVDTVAVRAGQPGLSRLLYAAAAGLVVAVIAQTVRRADRRQLTDSFGTTALVVAGVLGVATLIPLSRIPAGTQTITTALTATALALAVARATDAVLAWPRLAPQVPRGAAGVVLGAMLGTLAGGVLGSFLVGFTPTSGALIGLATAATAVLADLAVGYAEAGRLMAGEPPTLWIARHMQGPLGGIALAAPVAYLICVLFL